MIYDLPIISMAIFNGKVFDFQSQVLLKSWDANGSLLKVKGSAPRSFPWAGWLKLVGQRIET
jgi:hypothetical protein